MEVPLHRTRVFAHAPIRAAVAAALLAPLAACSTGSPQTAPDASRTGKPDDRPVTVTVTPEGRQAAPGRPVTVVSPR